MHILHLGKYYAPYRGGMETILQEMAEGLLDQGCDVTLVTSAHGRRSTREVVRGPRHGREGRLLRTGRAGHLLSQPLNPGLPALLRRELVDRRPDILHVHLPNPLAALACLALRLDPGVPRIPLAVWYHADITRQRLGARVVSPLVQACLREADGISVSARALRDGSPVLARWRDKTTVIPFGIDAAPWDAVVPRRDGPLLFVGRLVPYKGVGVLVEALARVPDARLDLVGEGPLEAALRAEVARLQLADRVRFLGEMERAGVAARLARARALVLPSVDRSEAFGLVQLEAMAAGVAVVCTDLPTGVREVGVSDRTCLRVTPGDPVSLAAALETVWRDDALVARLGEAGRARFADLFTREAMIGRLLAWYRQLAPGDAGWGG